MGERKPKNTFCSQLQVGGDRGDRYFTSATSQESMSALPSISG